jgi:glutathione peroxidase
MSVLDFSVPLLDGGVKDLRDYEGMVVLVVNTASECGFTYHYEGLEELYRFYKDDGFVVLGFPCNQFGSQEPGDAAKIKDFLDCNYTVTFPIFEKVEVNGENTHPFFKALKERAPGSMGSQEITWNFAKFLISRNGEVVERFASHKKPDSLRIAIERELAK